MKAIYGKLSIVSFVVPVVSLVALFTLIKYGDVFGLVLFIALFLLPPIGLILGYLSALKQEIPKYYRYIGFFLNFTWCIFLHPLFLFALVGWR